MATIIERMIVDAINRPAPRDSPNTERIPERSGIPQDEISINPNSLSSGSGSVGVSGSFAIVS